MEILFDIQLGVCCIRVNMHAVEMNVSGVSSRIIGTRSSCYSVPGKHAAHYRKMKLYHGSRFAVPHSDYFKWTVSSVGDDENKILLLNTNQMELQFRLRKYMLKRNHWKLKLTLKSSISPNNFVVRLYWSLLLYWMRTGVFVFKVTRRTSSNVTTGVW